MVLITRKNIYYIFAKGCVVLFVMIRPKDISIFEIYNMYKKKRINHEPKTAFVLRNIMQALSIIIFSRYEPNKQLDKC